MATCCRRLVSRRDRGFTLVEMMITMALTLLVMASTLGAMNNALRANEVAQLTTNMNQGLRTAMDIMVRDMLQVGQGLPSGRTIDIPNGSGATAVKLPGAPGTTRTMASGSTEMTAIVPGTGLGPTINGVATDIITVVLADGAFLSTISDYDVNLTKLCSSTQTMTVDSSVDISNGGADDLHPGDLIMLMKGSSTTLVQITAVDGNQTATFAANDSLNLNQTSAANGNLNAIVGTAPADTCTVKSFQPTTATRIRMISYYIDNVSDPSRPRLVRRVNNGSPTAYNNSSGTALAFDVENLQISYDLVDGVDNPAEVKFTSADLNGTGRCSPNPCSPNQVRKINIMLSGRSRTTLRQTRQYLRNTLTTQVSLRSMSFIDRYR
jgi:prepilin-type N-terminal cleavage/methylation domain-containing protein